jgi:hypothetical protein
LNATDTRAAPHHRRALRRKREKGERDRWKSSPEAQEGLRRSIEGVLRHVFKDWEEVRRFAVGGQRLAVGG